MGTLVVEPAISTRIHDDWMTPGVDHLVVTRLWYNTADPYAVHCDFRRLDQDGATVHWTISREQLLRAWNSGDQTGLMDVVLWRRGGLSGGRRMFFMLRSPDGTITGSWPSYRIGAFIQRMLAEVPVGEETQHLAIDGAIARLLEGTTP